eukprot:m.41069 g.41069  ORF g.41069 m.41069 type:complete len:398 (-) comp18692_c0_seq1:41-1234(-)
MGDLMGLSVYCGRPFELVSHLCSQNVKNVTSIVLYSKDSGTPTNSTSYDRFKIKILIGDVEETWELIFCDVDAKTAPDFIFLRDPMFRPPIHKIPSLLQWNPTEVSALVPVVTELIQALRVHHKSLAKYHPYELLQHEYNTTMGAKDFIDDFNVSVIALPVPPDGVISNACRPLRFTIVLNTLDVGLPKCPLQEQLSLTPIEIEVTYNPGKNGVFDSKHPSYTKASVTPKFRFDTKIKRLLGGHKLQPPNWAPYGFLRPYIEECNRNLRATVEVVVEEFVARRKYIASFLSHFGGALLEYDVQNFSKISLLLEIDNFYAIARICFVPKKPFPAHQPDVYLDSIYNLNGHGKLLQLVFNESNPPPYSPRWSKDEMAVRLKLFLKQKITEFAMQHTPQR